MLMYKFYTLYHCIISLIMLHAVIQHVLTHVFLKNSLSHRGAILWNILSNYYTDCTFKGFHRKMKKDKLVRELNFNPKSVQSLPRHFSDFKCY